MPMDDDLPDPLVPPEVDLRDFPYTPIYRSRLWNSSFHARSTDAEWRAGVTLWLKSWEQVPAGTLPADDIDLCRLAELGRNHKEWAKVKAMALHGWTKCSDGRLHHSVVAEVVAESWERRSSARKKGMAGAKKRWGEPSGTDGPATAGNSSANRFNGSTNGHAIRQLMPNDGNRREGNRSEVKGEYPLKPPRGLRAKALAEDADFSEFYQKYPIHDAPDDALKAWRQVIKAGAKPPDIMAGLAHYPFRDDPKFIKAPAAWLRAGCWKAEPSKPRTSLWDRLENPGVNYDPNTIDVELDREQ